MAVTEVSTPRSVLMDEELWGDCNEAASDRQKRTRQKTTASDIIRAGSRLLSREEIDQADAPSRRIAADLMAVLADSDPEHEETVRGIVRRVLLGDTDSGEEVPG